MIKEVNETKDDNKKCTSKPIAINMVTPAEATVRQAKQELQHIKEGEETQHLQTKRKREKGNIGLRQKKSKKSSPLFEKITK